VARAGVVPHRYRVSRASPLADLIEANEAALVERWSARVVAGLGERLRGPELVDSLPDLLRELVASLRAGRRVGGAGAENAGREHGRQRHDVGADLNQVVREYGILREVILELVEERATPLTVPELRVLLDVIGAAIADSVMQFVAARDEALRRDAAAREAATEALRDSDRRKSEFLGVLSHELRNPLAPIRNSVFVLERSPVGSEDAARAREVIRRQTEHLARLIEDLLDVTRISRGKIELRRERVDVIQAVRRAGEDRRTTFEERGIDLELRADEGPLWVEGDPTRLEQIVGNLLQNAAKFTPRGGHVTVAVSAEEGAAAIRVRDDGAGIDPTFLERAFEPFVQGEQSLARTGGGLGLGLALVKGLAELHGGSARAHSAGRGTGTELLVILPLATADAGRADAAAEPAPRRARRVLVVDDNHDAADSLGQLVSLLGHDVDVAYDGPTAIARARERRPDVVLCDLGLPGMTGYDVARSLRDLQADGVRLVAVSGYGQPEDVRAATEAGFDRHVTKPADPGVLERLLG
jgi:signal transduction histidine kinase